MPVDRYTMKGDVEDNDSISFNRESMWNAFGAQQQEQQAQQQSNTLGYILYPESQASAYVGSQIVF